MALTVLIVEDEQSAARLLSGIAAEVGLSARTTGSGKEAQQLCAQAAAMGAPFSAVVLDLVLAELDGFQFAKAARAHPWGAQLPLVVVSGVYKKLPADFAAQVKPAAFFAKPFEPAALRGALAKLTGAQPASPTLEGELSDKPPAALFVELLRSKATGTLTLTQDQEKRVITFQQGQVRFGQSNLKSETMGASQIASGLIKQTSFDRAVALAKQQGIPLHEALATARVMTPDQLKVGLKQQTTEVAVGALGWNDGKYRFEQKPPEAVSSLPDMRMSPVVLVLEAAKRHADEGFSRRWLEQYADERLNRSPELEREVFALKAHWPGESVTPFATAERSVAEVMAHIKEQEIPLLRYLCQSGLLRMSGGSKTALKPQSAQQVSDDEDQGKTFTPEAEKARRMLIGESDHLRDASHYEVLGVSSSAEVEEIKKAYFVAAKRFHSDSFSGLELGSARRAAEGLFAKVNEAYSVLSDKNKRAEHDVFLDRRAKGLPTDVAAILRAEGMFQKGELLFKAGRWADAEAQFREAIVLNHVEAEFHAYLGMAIFKRTGEAGEGLQHVEKALELEPRLRSGILFAVQMLEALGDVGRARSLLKKAYENDPEFDQAKDEFRRLKDRPAGQAKGGFLSRLLKK
jgi:CheY-like chemotaxis protein/tetratricopeptide (TPR) repeat protein